ncbi:DUF6252 family protein [Flavobacterium branchiarum]|uniref:DUF6252 family protein n=1 Tax=Flavobacterium branchiarum TaxID=1114870 RepID=A0ABV5FJ99_9FLAO|nr:DUF6252 family protein [Flavobacterium branchiarum]MDN3675697.1 DUF6252 family protein [Flavobacterium branchiarum]
MRKWFFLLSILVLLVSCDKEEVVVNNPAFQSLNNEVFWRATSFSANIDSAGKLTVIGKLGNDSVVLQTALAKVQSYALGIDNISTATYTSTLLKKEVLYKTGKELGGGQIIITQFNKETSTVSGTFTFVAPNEGDIMAVEKSVRFKEGVFYKVPVTLSNSTD